MIKSDFPIFRNLPDLIYLDNGASTQKPQEVINALSYYYENLNSNIGRGVYQLAEKSGIAYEATRKNVAKFIHTKKSNILFSAGTTLALNQIAHMLESEVREGQKIVLSILEHHANILPWQRLAKKKNLTLVYVDDNEFLSNPSQIPTDFWQDVAIIALTHVSNVTGQILPIKEWCKVANSYGIISVIDGAQGISSELVNVEDINCDFYVFSAHKLYAPMGVGILYLKDRFLQNEPMILGGGIIEDVVKEQYFLLEEPARFEAGTPNVADIYGLSHALDYLNKHDFPLLISQMKELSDYLYEELSHNPYIEILNKASRNYFKHSHIISFNIKNIHAHDVGTFLAQKNIAVRVGKHCTHPLHTYLNTNSSVRVSLGIYNTTEDIDKLITEINKCIHFFGD